MAGKGDAGNKPVKTGLGDPLYQPEGGNAQVEYVRTSHEWISRAISQALHLLPIS